MEVLRGFGIGSANDWDPIWTNSQRAKVGGPKKKVEKMTY